MSIEQRQPGRPTVEEFTGAALRFIKDDYPLKSVHLAAGMYVSVHQLRVGKDADIDILRREILADGIPGKRESIRDFAIRQLAWYQKSKRT